MGEGGMVAETPSRGSSRFPEIRVNLRTRNRSSQILLPPFVQLAAASAVVAFAVAVCFFALVRPGYERALADKEAAMVRAETANAGLRAEVASLRDKLAVAARDRRRATADLDRTISDRDRLRARIAELEQKQSPLDFAVR